MSRGRGRCLLSLGPREEGRERTKRPASGECRVFRGGEGCAKVQWAANAPPHSGWKISKGERPADSTSLPPAKTQSQLPGSQSSGHALPRGVGPVHPGMLRTFTGVEGGRAVQLSVLSLLSHTFLQRGLSSRTL